MAVERWASTADSVKSTVGFRAFSCQLRMHGSNRKLRWQPKDRENEYNYFIYKFEKVMRMGSLIKLIKQYKKYRQLFPALHFHF